MLELLFEAIRQALRKLGIDLAKGRTWIVHEGDWLNGRRRTIRIGYDGDGHEIGRVITEQTDDGAGRKTTTTLFYDSQGHESGRMAVVETTDAQGNTSTTTTTTDAQGHVTGQSTTSK